MSSSSFSQIRSQALHLEKQTEQLLSKYSQFQNTATAQQSSLEPSDDETSTETQITEILSRRSAIVSKLNRISDSSAPEGGEQLSTSKLQQISRHREILQDHTRAFHRIKSQLEEERNRNNLLFSVQSDISNHKRRTNPGAATNEIDPNSYILEEGQRADSANTLADRLLQGALQTRDELMNQRQYLTNAQLRIFGVASSVPGLNVLISKINTRRKRDTLILASIIAACILLLFFV